MYKENYLHSFCLPTYLQNVYLHTAAGGLECGATALHSSAAPCVASCQLGPWTRQGRGALGMFIVLGLHHARRDVLLVYTDMGHALLMRVHA